MRIRVSTMNLIYLVLFLSTIAGATSSRKLSDVRNNETFETDNAHEHEHEHHHPHREEDDPTIHVFFTLEDIKVGNTIPIFFPYNDPSTAPKLLPKEEADSIPFSSSQLPRLLHLFSFPKDSPQAKAVEHTLRTCENKPFEGEAQTCATSLESMLDFARATFGPDANFKALTTRFLSDQTSQFSYYTVLGEPEEVVAPVKVGCHTMPYPYVVYFCHNHGAGSRVFEILMGDENGVKVEALAICHMDTSKWDKDHISFRALKMKPGSHHVCHFFPQDNLVWVPSSSA